MDGRGALYFNGFLFPKAHEMFDSGTLLDGSER